MELFKLTLKANELPKKHSYKIPFSMKFKFDCFVFEYIFSLHIQYYNIKKLFEISVGY